MCAMCASLGLRMKFKTLFMSDEKNTAIVLVCQAQFFNISKQFGMCADWYVC